MSPNQSNTFPTAVTQAIDKTGGVATDNTSVERLLVPDTNQRDTPEDVDTVITREQTKPAEKSTPKRKTRAVKGKGKDPFFS
jgi:hypothetical protein